MKEIAITLHTSDHCIETAAKNEFRRIMDILLSADAVQDEFPEQLELLREFIETADFNTLRALDERLAGIKPGLCVIGRNSSGLASIKSISQQQNEGENHEESPRRQYA